MPIWTRPLSLDVVNAMGAGTMMSALDIVFTEIGDDYVRATMPVDDRHTQPMGLLHGGASVVLAETIGSMAAMGCLRDGAGHVVGLEINANHLRAVRKGQTVTATARPLHVGSATQVWSIEIRDDADRLACISRLTVAVRKV